MDLIIKPKSWLNTDPDYKLPVKRKKNKTDYVSYWKATGRYSGKGSGRH